MRTIALWTIMVSVCLANIIRVPDEQPTIQAGLNVANSNDTVLVAPGSYKERITWPGRDGIKLISEQGASATTIDGADSGVVVTISSSVTRTTIIKGFTITRGYTTANAASGIVCRYGSPSILNNRITRCRGAGIDLIDANNVLVMGNEISGCWKEIVGSWNYGGGIYIDITNNSAHPEICFNYIHHDTLRRGAWNYGAGIFCDANALIYQNVIEANVATANSGDNGRGAAGIYVDMNRAPMIFSNLIINNRTTTDAWKYGAGITCYLYSDATIINNTIVGNVCASGGWSWGGGIYNEMGCTTRIKNNVIANNQASTGSGIYNYTSSNPGVVIAACNDYFNNTLSGCTPGPGDITGDPLFVTGFAGPYFLSQTAAGQSVNSPCANAGDTLLMASPLKLDSLLRSWTTRTDTVPDQGVLDMGYHYPIPPIAPVNHDVGTSRIIAPAGLVDSGTAVTPVCSVYNYGSRVETYPVRLKIGASYNLTAQVSNHAPGAALAVTFPAWTALPRGALVVSCSTELTGDATPANDKQTGSVTVLARDVGAIRLISPIGLVDSGTSVTPACSLYNFGNAVETYTARMKIGAGYDNTAAVTSHSPLAAVYVTFPIWTAQVRGANALSCSTQLAVDGNRTNDRISSSVNVAVHDIGAKTILAPSGSVPPGSIVPSATVHNYGTTREACTVTFTINSMPPYTNTVNLSGLPIAADTTITFTSWTAATGSYMARCLTGMTTDRNRVNDTVSAPFSVATPDRIDVGVTQILEPFGSYDSASSIRPEAKVKNLGDAAATFKVFLTLDMLADGIVYSESLLIGNLSPGTESTVVWIEWPKPHLYANYTTRCSTALPGDINPANDTLSCRFLVVEPVGERGWVRMSDVPLGPKSKRVKDGGCLTAINLSDGSDASNGSDIYCLKGNNRCEFYAYNIATNTWTARESIPAFGSTGKKKMVKKGGTLSEAAGVIYGTKGNSTLEFWSYTPGAPAGVWTQKTDVPLGARNIKEGTGAAGITIRDSQYVYLLKGSNTTEFYRYSIAANTWEPLASAPPGASGKNYKNGSCIACDGDNTIYALKGSYNEFFAYDIAGNTWTTKTLLPLIGSSGKKKKVKDGAGLAAVQSAKCKMQSMPLSALGRFFAEPALERPERFFASLRMTVSEGLRMTVSEGLRMTGAKGAKSPDDGSRTTDAGGHIWALKGGNTYEYWCYLADSNRWIQKEDILTGGGKKVKGGGAFTSSGDALWALKGNNTFEFYKYVPAIAYRSPLTADRPEIQTNSELGTRNSELAVSPNPFSGATTISYSLSRAGNTSLKLYDVTGKLLMTLVNGYCSSGDHRLSIGDSRVARGIYLLRLEGCGLSLAQKLIVE